MEKLFRLLLICLVLTATSVLVAASPAGAGSFMRTDGNDVKGPLDLASVRVEAAVKRDRITVKTKTAFTARQLNGTHGWIDVYFDTNADRDFEYRVGMFYYRGKLRAVQFRGQNVVRQLPAHRGDARTVAFDVRRSFLGNIQSYDFAVFSYWSGEPCTRRCVDHIPNLYPLLRNDFTAPTIDWGSVPTLSTDFSADLTFDVGFSIKDDAHGSGIAKWKLQQSQDGGANWTKAAGGHATVGPRAMTGVEGEVTLVRVIAVDKQGNKRTSSIKHIIVPWDDQNASGFFQYSVRTPTTATGVTDAFLGTTSSLPQGTIVTATLPAGSNVCILGGPTSTGTTAEAMLSFDGTPFINLQESDSHTFRSQNCAGGGTSDGTVVTLEVTSTEPFVFDGMVLVR